MTIIGELSGIRIGILVYSHNLLALLIIKWNKSDILNRVNEMEELMGL